MQYGESSFHSEKSQIILWTLKPFLFGNVIKLMLPKCFHRDMHLKYTEKNKGFIVLHEKLFDFQISVFTILMGSL